MVVVVGVCWTAVVVSGGFSTQIITFKLQQNNTIQSSGKTIRSNVSPGV